MTIHKIPRKTIAAWLLLCCAVIFAMIVLGGITRLTGSGLSMVDWKFFGRLPPSTEAQWQETFERYQQFPEYKKVNYHMDVHDFKAIYWVEYSHRMLGRSLGLLFFIPMLLLFITRRVNKSLALQLLGMLCLGGMQGLLGWYMVKSGLVHDPHVSQYRLTAHFGLALLIYAYIFWVALGLLRKDGPQAEVSAGLRRWTYAFTALACVTILSGGFVAGLKAGLVYNTFPLMDGHWIPPGILAADPWWKSFFEDITTVQFDHRWLAISTFFSACALWWYAHRTAPNPSIRKAYHFLLAAMVLQVSLGITTLLLQVPLAAASLHQAGAVLVLTAVVYTSWRARA